MFQRARRPREFGPIRDSGQNGDGTVPTGSARDLRGAINVRKIDGNHNQIANDDATIALIRRHLARSTEPGSPLDFRPRNPQREATGRGGRMSHIEDRFARLAARRARRSSPL